MSAQQQHNEDKYGVALGTLRCYARRNGYRLFVVHVTEEVECAQFKVGFHDFQLLSNVKLFAFDFSVIYRR
jgi:hypothetical protein